MTTALFMLRVKELNISLAELHFLSMGSIYDMFTERGNDTCEYDKIATQEDFARF